MGNQPSGEHGHSHNGKPCHGHGPQAGHGHSHGAPQPQHGHSHNGKPCHGHGPQAGHGHSHGAPQAGHGHSHGGKPCHGHGPQANHGHSHGAQQQHGHSHGAQQQHGHSHNGKPCHGHGDMVQQPPTTPQTPEEVEMLKKQRGIQLFMTQMFIPKIPIIWAHFHTPSTPRDDSKATTSSGMTVPFVEGEEMNRAELREFIEEFLIAQSEAEGHQAIRFIECLQTELQILMGLGFQEACANPEAEIKLPFEKFKQMVSSFVMRITISRYDAMPFICQHFGLGAMKLPKLPQLAAETEQIRIRTICREQIMPLLIDFVTRNAEANQDNANAAIASGFIACIQSVKQGIKLYVDFVKKTKVLQPDEDPATLEPEELNLRWTKYALENADTEGYLSQIIGEIDNLEEQCLANPQEVLGQLKTNDSETTFHPHLIAHNVSQLIVIPLLTSNPVALQHIAKEWGLTLHLIDETQTALPAPAPQ